MALILRSLLLVLLLTTSALAASGIKGRAAWRGELVEGLKIRAYRQIEDIAAGKVVAVSTPTGLDGTYQLELPPGEYVLTARSDDGAPRPGDYFCYYSGSPVRVRAGAFTNVGFNLIKVPKEAPPKRGRITGIEGEISYQGAPLERVYLYVYKNAAGGFKGPGYNIVPVEKGRFRLRLPPGDYYLLARKRAKGGRFGPIEIGDYFNFYYGNPVHIDSGQVRDIRLETITRLSMLEKDDSLPFAGVRGQVLGPAGKPAVGLYVFAYRKAGMTGTPDYFSNPTDAAGNFELPLPEGERFYLLARESFGGPASAGELYGRLDAGREKGVEVTATTHIREVTIHVQPHQGS